MTLTSEGSSAAGHFVYRTSDHYGHYFGRNDTIETMIVGTGTDMTEIVRIRQSIARFGDRFLDRIFTADEIAYCQRKKVSDESFAARFAAKEAGAKALGTGISRGVSWKEIEVRRRPGQRPTLHFSGKAAEIAQRIGVISTHLSLSHTREMALAVVILEAAER